MQDQYAGQPGTFYTDPDTGTRMTAEEWAAKQQAGADKTAKAKPETKPETQPEE